MNLKSFAFIAGMWLFLSIISCTPETLLGFGDLNTSGVVDSKSADDVAITFGPEAGNASIAISANKAWSVSFINGRADDWISVSPSQGEGESLVKINIRANDSYGERSATLKIESEELSKTIRITQKQNNAVLVSSSKVEVDANGKTVTIEVKHNIDYTYKIDDACASWISKAGTKALTTDNLNFVITPNTSFDKREGKVIFSSSLGDEVVSVYQAGEDPALVLSQSEYNVSGKGETISVEVSSNVDVEYSISANWVKEVVTKTMSTDRYTFEVLPNNGYDARDAEITFVNRANNLTETVKIHQRQKDALILSVKDFVCDPDGETIEIVLQSNVEYEYTSDVDWIAEVNTKVLVEHIHSFNVAALPEGVVSRKGYITFTNTQSGISEQVTVSQSDAIITFADDEVKAICVGNWDKNGDGELSEKEAASVTSIDEAFSVNTKITTFKEFAYFSGVKSLPTEAFKNCSRLTEIILPRNLTSIGDSAFSGCTSLVSISIPEGVTHISNELFWGCTSLVSVTIPEGVIFIGEYAFKGCSSLTSVKIPRGVTTIKYGVFLDCAALASVIIPEGVTFIDSFAFYGCSSLVSVTIPEGVRTIEDHVFRNCSSLVSVTIPEGVTSIAYGLFYGCSSLSSIIIPEGVTHIHNDAFRECASLVSVTIPEGVTTIGNDVFKGCSSLTSVIIPEGVTSIGGGVLQDCISLTSVIIPEGVTIIWSSSFENCTSLTSVTIPEGITSIKDYAFRNCSKLNAITINTTTPPDLGVNSFHQTNDCPIYVPSGAVAAYKGADGWKDYAGRIYAKK